MNTNNKSVLHWLIVVCLLLVITACTGIAVGTNSDQSLQIDDGVVKVKDQTGDWVPVAGNATFELVGAIESMDPWVVTGRTLETNELTQIAEGLQVGDLVRVQGAILEDDTWVAYSIELAEEQNAPSIILIGIVDSVDPWVVNGIALSVTADTVITGDITPGMIVRVEILLLPDGTWEVLSISPLGDSIETPGCATVIATVLRVEGNQIQFVGWPTTVTLGDDDQAEDNEENGDSEENDDENEDDGDEDGDENEGEDDGDDESGGETISADQLVLAVVCVSADGQIVIVQIIVLNADDNDDGTSGEGDKVLVCHKPSKNPHTLSISSSAVPAHLAHGDTLGPCP